MLIVAILYEGLKTLRENLAARDAKRGEEKPINLDLTDKKPLIGDPRQV